jgi:hypothetical protein
VRAPREQIDGAVAQDPLPPSLPGGGWGASGERSLSPLLLPTQPISVGASPPSAGLGSLPLSTLSTGVRFSLNSATRTQRFPRFFGKGTVKRCQVSAPFRRLLHSKSPAAVVPRSRNARRLCRAGPLVGFGSGAQLPRSVQVRTPPHLLRSCIRCGGGHTCSGSNPDPFAPAPSAFAPSRGTSATARSTQEYTIQVSTYKSSPNWRGLERFVT